MPLLSEQEINLLCDRLNILASGREVIKRIRTSEPSRSVKSCGVNVPCRYPSRKMGFTIQAESHKLELSHVFKMEHDDNVHEYYDQPPPIKLNYKSIKNRNLGVMHTPDYFEISKDLIGYIECKKEEELEKLSEKQPNRYVRTDDGTWICPPGIEAAALNGLSYVIKTDNDFTWQYIENIEFLEDYLHEDCPPVSQEKMDTVIDILKSTKVETIQGLIEKHTIDSDSIYKLIADEIIYFDINNSWITDIDKAYVFIDKTYAEAYAHMIIDSEDVPLHTVQDISLDCGSVVDWDGKMWKLLNAGTEKIILEPEAGDPIPLSRKVFEELVKKHEIRAVEVSREIGLEAQIAAIFAETRPQDLKKAMSRQEIIVPIVNGEKSIYDINNVSERTLYNWISAYKEAQREYGIGLIGLIPKTGKKGNRNPKLNTRIYELMEEEAKRYETATQRNIESSHRNLEVTCKDKGLQPPSVKTFSLFLRSRPRQKQIEKRQGSRSAYKHEKPYWLLERETPRHGNRPFHIGHIDHTELDFEFVDSKGRNLGKAWLTILIDAFSRRILAFYISFNSESSISALMVMRECVRRHQKLPKIIIVDNGSGFKSIAFEAFLARHEIIKKSRPAAKSRFGSVCERIFGTTNTEFIYNLIGNTQLTKTARIVTKSHNPKNLAIWTLAKFKPKLSEFLYDIYDQDIHPSLDDSPRTTYERETVYFGARPHKIIPYTDEFVISTYPSPKKGTAKINDVTGIQLNYIKYWHDNFRDPRVIGKSVPVRYDPENVGVAYAFILGRWVKCFSEYYPIFKNMSIKAIKIASAEIAARKSGTQKRKSISGRELALFIKVIESDEALMLQQRKDREQLIANSTHCHMPNTESSEPDIKTDFMPTIVLANEDEISDLGDL